MLDTFFKISQRGSSVAQEVRGGVVTFFTMAYIVALNPLIIGLAYSNGYVIMQDLCLGLYGDNEAGSFYESVLHELTHQLDYHEGRKLRKTYRSQEKDYLDVSYFLLKEFRDDNGRTVRQWEHKPGIKLVSSYAGTSPAENFAETIALS